MATTDKLLQSTAIATYIAEHRGAEEEIKAAAKQLSKYNDAEKALIKLLPALTKKTITVFFSYKKKDERTARKIIEQLQLYSAGKLEIKYMASLKAQYEGQPYREKIKDSIKEANWFILLFPDPNDDWDWCLFETGLFAAQYSSADRLICLHHPSKKPKPIEEYNMVAAEQQSVESFLQTTFLNDNPIPGLKALNPAIKNNIPTVAKLIVDAISKPKDLEREIFEPWVEIHVTNPKTLKTIPDLDNATIINANQKALDLFRLLDVTQTWGEFRGNLSENNTKTDMQWLNDLCRVIHKIANRYQFYPVQAVFHNAEGKMYRPVVCAIDKDRESKEIEVFHLTFIEDVSSVDRSAMPDNLSILANVLRSAFRFRWEVIEKFGKKLLSEEDIERLENAITRIQQDWDSRNVGDQKDILNLFPEKEQQKKIEEMLGKWAESKNNEKTGALDIAIKNLKSEDIYAILRSFDPINKDFLEMAADRFAEMVTG